VTDEERAKLVQLCDQAAKEMDPQRLLVIVQEINQLLEDKRERLRRGSGVGEESPV